MGKIYNLFSFEEFFGRTWSHSVMGSRSLTITQHWRVWLNVKHIFTKNLSKSDFERSHKPQHESKSRHFAFRENAVCRLDHSACYARQSLVRSWSVYKYITKPSWVDKRMLKKESVWVEAFVSYLGSFDGSLTNWENLALGINATFAKPRYLGIMVEWVKN